jgi:hypothetical protein
MRLAFFMTITAWLMMMMSAVAFGQSEKALDNMAWATATITGPSSTVEVKVGVKAVLARLTNSSTGSPVTTTYVQAWADDVCGNFAGSTMNEGCGKCEEQATASVLFIALSIITQIGQILYAQPALPVLGPPHTRLHQHRHRFPKHA